jgi:hypothetical protein
MRRGLIVLAAISFAVALLLAIAGLWEVLHMSDMENLISYRRGVGDEAAILAYTGRYVKGIGLTCVGIICAIIGNTLVNAGVAHKRQ